MSVVCCPRCEIALKSLDLGLYCRQCEGNWLNFEELDAALAAKESELEEFGLKTNLRPDNTDIDRRTPTNCPVCAEKMRRFPYLFDSGVLVDVCKQHGMWLDDGALGSIRAYCQATGVELESGKKKKGLLGRIRAWFT